MRKILTLLFSMRTFLLSLSFLVFFMMVACSDSINPTGGATSSTGGATSSSIANMSYMVTFNSQGGSSVNPQEVNSGSLVTEPSVPTKSGYGFAGWYKEIGCTTKWTFASDQVLAATTLFARWLVYTVGLEFTLTNGNTEYSVSHGTVTSGSVIIPEYWNGKKVTTIKSDAFSINCKAMTSLTIPTSITTIGEGAFFQCEGLTTLDIPSGVTRIETLVFYGCINLVTLILPNGITFIGDTSFYGTKISSFPLPTSLVTIDAWAFMNAYMGSVTIPSTVTSIGNSAFSLCANLMVVTVNSVTPPTAGTSMFSVCPLLGSIRVPAASVSAYKAAAGWSTYAAKIISQ